MQALKRVSAWINQWVEYVLFGLGLAMTLVVAVQVFFRYGLNHSLFWSEELARFLLVWLTFLGASTTYYRKANPGVDFIYMNLSSRGRKVCSLLTHVVSMALFAVMIVYGCKFAYFVRLQVSPALQIPKWIIMGIIPLSGILLMAHGLCFFLTSWQSGHHDH